MEFEIISVDYSNRSERSREGVVKYIKELHDNGFNNSELLVPDSDKDPCMFKIKVSLDTMSEFVKLTSVLGEVLFDGRQITIYDSYIE